MDAEPGISTEKLRLLTDPRVTHDARELVHRTGINLGAKRVYVSRIATSIRRMRRSTSRRRACHSEDASLRIDDKCAQAMQPSETLVSVYSPTTGICAISIPLCGPALPDLRTFGASEDRAGSGASCPGPHHRAALQRSSRCRPSIGRTTSRLRSWRP